MGEIARFDAQYHRRIWRILGASLVMGAVLVAANGALSDLLMTAGWRYPALALLIAIGGVSYAIAGQFLGAFKLSELKAGLRRAG